MKLTNHQNTLETNVRNETQDFSIGDCSVIVDILRNRMYQYKIQTSCQEIISNAKDACRESGKKDSDFIITVPTPLNPVFAVKDSGIGISPDRITNVFLKYGSSTKRNDNNQIGGFGLGAKSFFSYTDSFTITTIVDGFKRVYVAHIGTNNQGRLDLISTEPTTEESGTEVQVAVKRDDIGEFINAVKRAIYFWEEKPIIKGTLNTPTLVKGLQIGTHLEVIESGLVPDYIEGGYGSHSPLAVIDGIPYAIGDKLLNRCPTLKKLENFVRRKLLIHIGNGVVEVAASRESIADSDKTKDALEKLAVKMFIEVKTHIAGQFKGITSVGEYLKVYKTLNAGFTLDAVFSKFKDYTIKNDMIQSQDLLEVEIEEVHCMGRYGRTRGDKILKETLVPGHRSIPLANFDDLFFVDKEESLVVQNRRIRSYFDQGKSRLFLIKVARPALQPRPYTVPDWTENKKTFKKVIADLEVKDFQTLTYAILPKQPRVKVSRQQTEFCMHVINGDRHSYTTLANNTQKWFYVTIGKNGWEYSTEDLRDLGFYLRHTQNANICGLAGRALEMVKGDTNFSSLTEWLNKFKPSKTELTYVKQKKATNEGYAEALALINGINDKRLTDLVKEYKQFDSLKWTFNDKLPSILLPKVQSEPEYIDFVKKDEEFNTLLFKTYPLLIEAVNSYYNKANAQELGYYLNAKFKGKK